MDLFHVECFVEDKNLGRVQRLLAGVARDVRTQPVTNAVSKRGKLTAESGGSLLEIFVAHIKKRRWTVFAAADVKEFLREVGRPVGSHQYLVKSAFEAGLIKKVGKGASMKYRVVQSGKAK